MNAAMMKLTAKLGPRLPELLARAAMGDLAAIAELAMLGVAVVGSAI